MLQKKKKNLVALVSLKQLIKQYLGCWYNSTDINPLLSWKIHTSQWNKVLRKERKKKKTERRAVWDQADWRPTDQNLHRKLQLRQREPTGTEGVQGWDRKWKRNLVDLKSNLKGGKRGFKYSSTSLCFNCWGGVLFFFFSFPVVNVLFIVTVKVVAVS